MVYTKARNNVRLFRAFSIQPAVELKIVEEDPEDNKFIEAAIAGGAEFIVSQDKHLLKIREYRGVKVVTPEEFLGMVA